MYNLSIPYSEDLLITSGKTRASIEAEMRFLLAVKLFEMHRLTMGKAAEFCGIGKVQFMFKLGELNIPVINIDDDQIADELIDD